MTRYKFLKSELKFLTLQMLLPKSKGLVHYFCLNGNKKNVPVIALRESNFNWFANQGKGTRDWCSKGVSKVKRALFVLKDNGSK